MILTMRKECKVWAAEMEEIAGHSLVGPKGSVSAQRLADYLYKTCLLKPQYHDGKITTNVEALQRIVKGNVPSTADTREQRKSCVEYAQAVVERVLRIRDQSKQCSLLATGLENNRMRCTYVVGGTESFRFSSSGTHTGRGTNLQNIDKRLRHVFIPDPGFTMVQMDQERAESMVVAYVSRDGAYIEAHLKGNTHVTVARLLWPDEEWNGQDVHDRALAAHSLAANKIGRHTMYYLAKRCQHGLNYLLTPHGMARELGLTVKESERVYTAYFEAFPGIKEWHAKVIEELKRTGKILYPGGYSREFFGRLGDRATHREAISSVPQSIVAWTNHIVWARMYKQLDGPDLQVLGHGHDSVLFQVRESKFGRPLRADLGDVKELTHVPWTIHG
ncbi:hypothetical protein LCGC14_2892770, partial [marine sediment metagenome]